MKAGSLIMLSAMLCGIWLAAQAAPNSFLVQLQQRGLTIPTSSLGRRIMSEYGAMWVSEAILPQTFIFEDADSVNRFQVQADLVPWGDGNKCHLQRPAAAALTRANNLARKIGAKITPRGRDACLRDYQTTKSLWLSRVEPNLDHYVKQGKIRADRAAQILREPLPIQAESILNLEAKGLLFDKYRSTSILRSVALPGSSQHLSGLAADITEYEDTRIVKILNDCGWYRTVLDDVPHFTYLGVPLAELGSKGLKEVKKAGKTYWLPNL